VAEEETPLFDASGALTREFLLRRGACCENGCRNCPYGFKKEQAEDGKVKEDTEPAP
jgi:hypothetical protein